MDQRPSLYTPEDDALLTRLWNDDRKTGVIALMLKRSKGSVKNRAKRIGLPAHPNPVKNAVRKPKVPRHCRGCGCELPANFSNKLYCREGCWSSSYRDIHA